MDPDMVRSEEVGLTKGLVGIIGELRVGQRGGNRRVLLR